MKEHKKRKEININNNLNIKNNVKGITLIALVVTIIVLLILAGISIQMLTGDNGILQRAGQAKENTEETAFKEQLQLEVLGNYDKEFRLNSGTLKENIEKNISNSSVSGNELPLTVRNTETNKTYLIDRDGTVMLYDENAVARIKDKFYETLQLAIDEVPKDNSEKEIIVLKNTTENVSISANKNVLLDLNAKTITGSTNQDYTITNEGNLTIKRKWKNNR